VKVRWFKGGDKKTKLIWRKIVFIMNMKGFHIFLGSILFRNTLKLTSMLTGFKIEF
jgi:hypothetical protein